MKFKGGRRKEGRARGRAEEIRWGSREGEENKVKFEGGRRKEDGARRGRRKESGARWRAEERKGQGKSIFREVDFLISSEHFSKCKKSFVSCH